MGIEPAETGQQIDLRKAEATRRRILDAAARVFMHKGYVATRLTDIAEEAEMRAGSLYYHFESKEQIFEEVLQIGIALVFDAVRAAVEELGPEVSHRTRIGAAIEAHLTMLLQHGDYTSANFRNFGQIQDALQLRHLPLRQAYGDYLRGLLEAARDAGEIRADADLSLVRMLLLGALNWSIEWYDPEKRPLAEIAGELQRMLFDGIGRTAD